LPAPLPPIAQQAFDAAGQGSAPSQPWAEHKFRDPYGIVFDIFSHGWDGAGH
jgi:hypothetical protein